jgi:hypothetical protein
LWSFHISELVEHDDQPILYPQSPHGVSPILESLMIWTKKGLTVANGKIADRIPFFTSQMELFHFTKRRLI